MAAREDSNSASGSVAGVSDDPQASGHAVQERPDDDDDDDGLSIFNIAKM